jgi:glycosyltransferase involved in cell wall biosynthesis
MRILLVHNFYQIPGGEDSVFHNESTMLDKHQHQVKTFTVCNDDITGKLAAFKALLGLFFSPSHYRQVKQVLSEFKPDVVHVHNYFPLVSPAVFYACRSADIPVVHTLHNFRAICPTSLLMHNGVITEKSITQGPWWTISKRVYKGSLIGTIALASMIAIHKRVGTWHKTVDGFICLTEFAKNVYERAGWPVKKLFVKPNFLIDSALVKTPSNIPTNGYALFVGRLCKEKGLDLLLNAWQGISFPLVIIGDGPEKHLLDNVPSNIIYLGSKPKDEVLGYVKQAQFLVMASTWYEGFPMVLVEAFSQGTCALVPNIGGMAEVVVPDKNGMHFDAGDSQSLHSGALALINNLSQCEVLGHNARAIFEEKYSEQLINIYQQIISHKKLGNER